MDTQLRELTCTVATLYSIAYVHFAVCQPHNLCLARFCCHQLLSAPHNTFECGRYDDEWGDYRMVVGDHIGYRFEIMSRLGKGSFGQVASLLLLPP